MTAITEIKLGKVKQAIEDARNLFEYHKEKEEYCDKCHQPNKRDSWYSFKSEVIHSGNELYNRMSDIIHEANVGEDYGYNWVKGALDDMGDMIDNDENDIDVLADLDFSEAVDSAVNPYTTALADWLASSAYNAGYLDEAVKEGATENILMVAQYKAIEEIYYAVRDALMDYLNTKDEK